MNHNSPQQSAVVAELRKFEDAKHRRARNQHDRQSLEGPSPENKASRFNFTSLDSLLAEPQELIAWVVDRMLACASLSILAGKPKAGKSTWARNLALAIALGLDFLGRPTRKGKVIYLCLEEKRSEIAEHFRRMGAIGDDILIYTGSTPKDAFSALDAAIEEHSPALVIIDPLSRFVRIADFNSYAEVTRQLEPLIDLARLSKCGTHIIALHHNGKGGDMREAGDAVLGSTGIFGAVDTLLTVRKREGLRTIESIQRYGEDLPETIIQPDPQTGVISAHGDMKQFALDYRKKVVLEHVGHEPLSEAAIKELVGGTNAGLTSKAVRVLFDDGVLVRIGAGRKGEPFLYMLKSEPESADSGFPNEIVIPANVANDEVSIEQCVNAQRIRRAV